MLLDIVKYGDPVLRQKGERVGEIMPEITQLIDDMVETMHEAHGIGLAAQQVGKALQLTMVDVTDVEDRPSCMSIDGEAVKPEDYMPLILLNPEWTAVGNKKAEGPEGCLSFPEVYGEIERPEEIAEVIRGALKHIPVERLILCSDCGMGREGMSRRHARYKMVSMVLGTNIVRKELGLPEAECLAADGRYSLTRVED